jgi:hypothetical protein
VKRAWPYALFGAITLACFWKFLFLGWTLYDVGTLQRHLGTASADAPGWFASHRPAVDRGDTILVLPMLHRVYNEGLHHGELRLWNPHLFCGYPLYYDTILHPFYPPNLIFHAILPPRIAYDLLLLLHFFFSGAAMYWLLRGMGRSDAAAALGGALWMLLGYNTLWFTAQMFLGAGVFAPLALLGIHLGLARRDVKPIALAGLAMGLVILGSHAQHAIHLLIFFSLWLLVCAVRDRESRTFILKAGAIFVVTALGVGMAAILTRLDSVMNGLRIAGDDLPLHYGDPWRLPLYLSGIAIGKVCYADDNLLRSEFTIQAGVLGTALAVAGAVRSFRDPMVRFLSIFSAAALLVVFLKPLAQLALLVPVLNNSMPARWVYVVGFCLTMLAAWGLDALRADPAKTTRIMIFPAGISLGLFCFHLSHGAVAETFVGFAMAAAAIFTATRPRWCLAFCFAAILVDLLPDFVLFNRHADPKPLEISRASLDLPGDEAGPWRATGSVRLDGGPADPNLWTLAIGNNLLALAGVDGVMGYESLAPMAAVRYCIGISGPKSIAGSGRVLAVANLESSLLHVANMRFVLWPFAFELEPRFRKKWTRGPLTLYENPAALPRAFLVSSAVKAASDEEALQILKSSGFQARTTVVLQEVAELPRTADGAGTVTWTSCATDRLELQVQAAAEAILVVSDTWDAGWEAQIDGQETPVWKGNLAFRALAIPAGAHRIVMRFRPPSARNGLLLTGAAIAGVIGLCCRRKRSAS